MGREIELFALGPGDIEGGCGDDPTFAIEIAQEHVDAHPGEHVVESIGVLGHAAMEFHSGPTAVRSELANHVNRVARTDPRQFAPFIKAVLLRGCRAKPGSRRVLQLCVIPPRRRGRKAFRQQ
jgi:hypothetical protein